MKVDTNQAAPHCEAEADFSPAAVTATLPPPVDDYSTSLRKVQDAVRHACARQTEWQGRIAAGIRAALELAAAEPGVARALTAAAHSADPETADRYVEGLESFSSLLNEAAPHPRRFPVSTDEALIGAIATVVGAHVQAATTDQLLGSAPD